jgi:methylase of polypeptide subunit release factors
MLINQPETMTLEFSEPHLLLLLNELRQRDYQFTTITPLSHGRVNARTGNEWACSLTDILGWSRPFHKDVIPEDIFRLMQSARILAIFEDGWRSLIRVSSLEDQLFMHSAFPTAENDAVFFGPDTYRYAVAIKNLLSDLSTAGMPPVRRAVDIGCGSGAGAILVGLAIPDARVWALDINDKALAFTRINAGVAQAGNVTALNSNILQAVPGDFDLIIANPPYLLDGSQRAYRHGGGTLGAELSLSIIDEALRRLSPAGTLLLYTGVAIVQGVDLFKVEVEKMISHAEFEVTYLELDPDIFGEELDHDCYREVDRIACILLTISRKPQ